MSADAVMRLLPCGLKLSGFTQHEACVFCLVGCRYHQAMSRPVEVMVTFLPTVERNGNSISVSARRGSPVAGIRVSAGNGRLLSVFPCADDP